MTTRVQVTFQPDQHRRAKRRAADLGISMAEFVRRSVARALEGPDRPPAHISDIFGIGDSGGSDVARFKHQYIGEAVEADYLKKTRARRRSGSESPHSTGSS